MDLVRTQESLQPPERMTNVEAVVEGVVAAQAEAMAHYRRIIDAADGCDYVTQDLAIQIMSDEERHHRQFVGFAKGLYETAEVMV